MNYILEENYKIVNFEHCKNCVHWEKDENDDPCYDCLNEPTKYASEKPLYFEERPKTKKGT